MKSESIDKNKLLLEYEKMLEKLEAAEKWAKKNNIAWDNVYNIKYENEKVRNNVIEFTNKRKSLIKEIEFTRELLGLPN